MLAHNFPIAWLGWRCGEMGCHRQARGAASMAVPGALFNGQKLRKGGVVGVARYYSTGG
jgi:hypothetical protein